MIQQTTAYRVGELVFPTIQGAQKKEILDLMCGDKVPTDNELKAADFIVSRTDEIVAILTCEPRTKKPRSDKGTKRKPKEAPAP
jgi:hypothetical protein